MATYDERKNPRDERVLRDDLTPRSTGGYGIFGLLLVMALALVAWFEFGRVSPTVDMTRPSISTPAATPVPNANTNSTTTTPAPTNSTTVPGTTPTTPPSNNLPAKPAPQPNP